jgi:hypothetical protein
MGIAFEGVLQDMGLKDRRDDPLCNLLAKKIIELGQRGIRDSAQLRQMTIEAFKG